MLLFLGANGKWNGLYGCDKGTDQATSNLHSCDKKKTTPSDARKNDSAANRNTNATALRIITDTLVLMHYFPYEDQSHELIPKTTAGLQL